MIQIPDAPWVRNPEKYADMYYGQCYITNDDEDDNDGIFCDEPDDNPVEVI